MKGVDIVRLEPSDLNAGADVLAEAFLADPVFSFLLPDSPRRRRWLYALMHSNLRMLMAHGHVYRPAGSLDGVIGLAPPGTHPPRGGRAVTLGLRMAAATLASRVPVRSLHAGFVLIQAIERYHPRAPHWYLHVLGVHPRAQGRGVGAALMAKALALADRDRMHVHLETGNPANLPFYRRFGLDVIEEVHAPHGAPPMWPMQRPPVTEA